jgi:hypothetical protein
MSDDMTGKSGKTWLYVAGGLVSLPLLYVLTVGPAMVVVLRSSLASGAAAAFSATYGPLLLAAQVTGMDGALNSYVDACIGFAGMDPTILR